MSRHRPPRAVIDTNVLLDFWVFDDSAARALFQAVSARRVTVLSSHAVVDEFVDVLERPGFNLTSARRLEIRAQWEMMVETVHATSPAPLICSDSGDQKFLDLAFSARADWLVTKDKALLKLARQARSRGLAIMSAATSGPLLALAQGSELLTG